MSQRDYLREGKEYMEDQLDARLALTENLIALDKTIFWNWIFWFLISVMVIVLAVKLWAKEKN